MQEIFVFEKRGLSPDGRVIGRFAATGILPKFNEKLVAAVLSVESGKVKPAASVLGG